MADNYHSTFNSINLARINQINYHAVIQRNLYRKRNPPRTSLAWVVVATSGYGRKNNLGIIEISFLHKFR